MPHQSQCFFGVFGRYKYPHISPYATIIGGYQRSMVFGNAADIISFEHTSDYFGLKRGS